MKYTGIHVTGKNAPSPGAPRLAGVSVLMSVLT